MATTFRRPVVAYPASPASAVSSLTEVRSPPFASPRPPASHVARGRPLVRSPSARRTQSLSPTRRAASHGPLQRRAPSPSAARPPSPARRAPSPARLLIAREPPSPSRSQLRANGSAFATPTSSQQAPREGAALPRAPLGSAMKAPGPHRRSLSEPRVRLRMLGPLPLPPRTTDAGPSSEHALAAALAKSLERAQSDAAGDRLGLGLRAVRPCATLLCRTPHFAVKASSGLCRHCSNRIAAASGGRLLQVDSFGTPISTVRWAHASF